MKMTEFPRLGERLYEDRLPNGLLVRVVPKPGFAKTYAFLAVDYGSMDAVFTAGGVPVTSPLGVAHYLEHKMFDMPDGSAMQRFSQFGGNPNAFTSYDITAYYVECTDHVADNLRTLLEFVTTPYFTDESVEKERGIIAQEIRMYEDSAESRVFEALFGALFAHHPVRHSIAGTVESIAEITKDTLYTCYDAFYTPANQVLCVVGDVDPAEILAIAAQTVPDRPSPALQRDYGPVEGMEPVTPLVESAMEVSMPTFALGFKTEPAAFGPEAMVEELLGELASECLMGESAPLYTRLYEEGLIDADFSYGYEGMKGAAMLTAGGDSRDPLAVRDAILEEAQRLARTGIDPALFEQLKRSALGRRIRGLDSFESICYRLCAYHFEGVEYLTFPEVFEEITPARVEEFLRRTVTPQRTALSVIRPKQ